MGICREHCHTSNKKALMKKRESYVMTSTATLTQSGLLAVLLQRQRYKVIELARRRAHPEQARTAFRSTSIGCWRALTAALLIDHSAEALKEAFRGTLEIFRQANGYVSPNPFLHRAPETDS
jgi:hypothetical protein